MKLDHETNSKKTNIYKKLEIEIKQAIEKVKKRRVHKKNNLPLSNDI
jgi:hypothetical protein